MALTAEQRELIAGFVPGYQQYLDSIDYETDMAARRNRQDLYAQRLSPEGLAHMSELEFGQVISTLWSSRMWSNKGFFVDQVIADNGLPRLRDGLHHLLWAEEAVGGRYDDFRRAIKGLGTASITEILAFVHPAECGLWNERARKALDLLGFRETLPAISKSQITGRAYGQFNQVITAIRDELGRHGFHWFDLLDVNYFLIHVWQTHQESTQLIATGRTPTIVLEFDHNEVIDQLVAVGQWLGFQAEKEKKVAKGAQVDLIWQARIANLGVVTYVFEVQRRGSIDSLILNLQRAQNNPTVQRLIVVANHVDLDAVRREIASLPESFRKAVSYMEVGEAIRAARLIEDLSGIIGRLDLVRSEFSL